MLVQVTMTGYPDYSHSILIGLPVSTLTKHWLNSILCPAQFFFIKTIKSPPSANLCFPLAFHSTYNEIWTPISPTVLPVTSFLIQLNTKPLALSQNHRAHLHLRPSSRSNCSVIPGTRFPRSSCSLSSLNSISLQQPSLQRSLPIKTRPTNVRGPSVSTPQPLTPLYFSSWYSASLKSPTHLFIVALQSKPHEGRGYELFSSESHMSRTGPGPQ